ncbi:MAG: hypothetical protein V4635_15650 [Bacteroidota bacterium]
MSTSKKKLKAIWVSYDLGLKGDYIGLYTWLDTVGAKECGNNLAFYSKEYEVESIEQTIKDELMTYLKKLNETDRIYIIYRDEKMKVIGNFIVGSRKKASWEGYKLGIEGNEIDTEDE